MAEKSKVKAVIQLISIVLLARDALVFYKKNKDSIQALYKAGKRLIKKKI